MSRDPVIRVPWATWGNTDARVVYGVLRLMEPLRMINWNETVGVIRTQVEHETLRDGRWPWHTPI